MNSSALLASDLTAALKRMARRKDGLTHAQIASRLGLGMSELRELAKGHDGTVSVAEAFRRVSSLERGLAAAEEHQTLRSDRRFRFIDLFAGIGGIRRGFEAIGGQCVYTSEWDEYAQRTYRANFGWGEAVFGDIRTKEAKDAIPEHDVLVGGFPCQPFSIAGVSKKNSMGRSHGFADETQGTLFFDVATIIKDRRPAAFLLENVRNLASHDGGRTLDVILRTLQDELGYQVSHRVISSRHFVPQHRERIFIVGFREANAFDFDKVIKSLPPLDKAPKLGSILHHLGDTEEAYTDAAGLAHARYTISPKLWQYLQDYKAKHGAAGNGFGFGLVGPEDVTRTISARYYKDGSEILVDQSHLGLNPRKLTPRECARLQGFDLPIGKKWASDPFSGDYDARYDAGRMVIPVSDGRAWKQFGNSVAVPVIRHVAEHMAPFLPGNNAAPKTRRTKK